ncbi:TatD family hydrolase [Falsarthrobacter nasiphocae]|uniref:TatD DNase family protein n=1 Tax=Falsarthrobacter nasiphocae TaxID=189863 RepID=A0AAE3YGP3_9MICC|nr:TatD family hydrolase [Falsarthrobacter nasiphocae]MDR6891613.1 TatD DNase family protein [Falsarthrobacter nasiphocae]
MCTSAIPCAYRPQDAPDPETLTAKELKARRRREYPPAPEPLPRPVVDNHTHLNLRPGLPPVTPAEAMDAAEAVGVTRAVQVAFDLESARFTRDVVETEPRLLGAVAIHPNDAAELGAAGTLHAALEEIARIADHPRIRALGETGMDRFRTGPEGIGWQEESFRAHLEIAERLGKAVQIHDRDAHDDVVRILEDVRPEIPIVFHCFSGGPDLARLCNERGWRMSFSGTVTFANSTELQAALRIARPELILTETDQPYLTPHPYRGQPNATYMTPVTVRFIAETLGMDLAEFCDLSVANTEAVYGQW